MSTTPTALDRIDRALAASVSGASQAAFRAMFGILLAIEALRFFWNGWIEAHLVGPIFHFRWAGFGWVEPLPGPGMHLVLGTAVVLGVVLASGLWTRAASGALALLWTYIALIDKALYLNHHYLAVLLCGLLLLMPPARRDQAAPAWTLWALRGLWLIVYFWAGVTKLDADWLSGVPLGMSLQAGAHLPLIGDGLAAQGTAVAASWGITLLELGSPALLVYRRSRYPTIAAFVAFHQATVPFYDIGIFPWMSLAMLSLWLEPDWCAPPGEPAARARSGRWAAGIVAVGLAVQALLPARVLLDPGNPSWTMQSARGSWRLLAGHKSGWVQFDLLEPASGQATELSPLELLTPWQASKMARDPWMIRDFARWIAAEQTRRGRPAIQVRARTGLSLNGRPAVPLINPQVDLAALADDAPLYAWVLPLTEPRPARPIALGPEWWVDQMLGYGHFVRAAHEAGAHGELRAGRDAMERALALDPQRSEAPGAWVSGLLRAGRADQALVEVMRWIELAPSSPEAHGFRRWIHLEAGRPVQAELALEAAQRQGVPTVPLDALLQPSDH